MKISTNILGDIGRALRLTSPSPQENQLELPPSLLLELEPCAAIDTGFGASGGSSSAVMNSSWSGSTLGGTANSGPTTFLGSFCLQGLWRIYWSAQYYCNFQSLAGLTTFGFQNAAATKSVALCSFMSGVANTNVTVAGSCLLSFSENFQPALVVGPSGVGQVTDLAVSWVCMRVVL